VDEKELIEELTRRLISLRIRILKEKGDSERDLASWDIELDSIRNEILANIKRSSGESNAYMQRLNRIHLPTGQDSIIMGTNAKYLYLEPVNQLMSLLDPIRSELEIYGKQQSKDPQRHWG
jgi:hypothetical protein